MDDTYTSDEFAACCSLRGYCRKKDALKGLKAQGMETAQEADFERCYHDLNDCRVVAHGRKWTAMRIDGTNQSAPQHMGNSKGKSPG